MEIYGGMIYLTTSFLWKFFIAGVLFAVGGVFFLLNGLMGLFLGHMVAFAQFTGGDYLEGITARFIGIIYSIIGTILVILAGAMMLS